MCSAVAPSSARGGGKPLRGASVLAALDLALQLETPKLGADPKRQMLHQRRFVPEHCPTHLCRRCAVVTADATQCPENGLLGYRLGFTPDNSPAERVKLADECPQGGACRFVLVRRDVPVPPRPGAEGRGTPECSAQKVVGVVVAGEIAPPVRDPTQGCFDEVVVEFAAHPTALEASFRPGCPSAAISRRWVIGTARCRHRLMPPAAWQLDDLSGLTRFSRPDLAAFLEIVTNP
jgi:hypothetical protein